MLLAYEACTAVKITRAFSARRQAALLLPAVLYVRPSVLHTRGTCLNGSRYKNAFCTIWYSYVSSF